MHLMPPGNRFNGNPPGKFLDLCGRTSTSAIRPSSDGLAS
jgi:hypothetical protein